MRAIKKARISLHKLLLLQPNYKFRANSNNPDERRSVEEAFAQSVLWGFTIAAEEGEAKLGLVMDRWLLDTPVHAATRKGCLEQVRV